MKKQFYEKALPSQGVYCVTGIRDGKATSRFAETPSELNNLIENFIKGESNVFVALNSFKGHSRRAEDAIFAKSLFVDLDVGKGAHKYPDKAAALEGLGAFVGDTLPPPVVVDSGTGVHAYWLFDEDIPSSEWVVYAEKFKTYCTAQGLKIDPVVTADRARIMRVPDTLNYKTDPPTATRILTDEIELYDFSLFRTFLNENVRSNKGESDSVLSRAAKGLDEDTIGVAKIDPNFESSFEVIVQRSVDDDGGCAQIKYALYNADTLAEPIWHSELSIARQCVDYEFWIHEVSRPYSKYSPEETEKKANETLGKPHSCEVFNARNPDVCPQCPYWGKITNPLAVGKRLKSPTTTPENTIRSDENPEEIPVYKEFPPELAPYKRGPNGGIWYTPPAKKQEDGAWVPQKEVQLWKYDLYPIKRMWGDSDKSVLVIRHITPHDGIRDFIVDMSTVYSKEKFKEAFTENEVYFSPKHTELLMDYIIKWAEVMQGFKSAEQIRKQMGWTGKQATGNFVVGNMEIERSGRVVKTAASALVISVAKQMYTSGTFEAWKKSAALLNTPTYEIHAFPLMCAFGSPLLGYTRIMGVTVGLLCKTGVGKTGSLIAGQSLFGDPFELMIQGAKDGSTFNAFNQYYVGLKNIQMAIDEASNFEGKAVSDLMYKVTGGKNKMRLEGSSNTFREFEMLASLILVLTTNQSMDDKMKQYKANPSGEFARYIEFNLVKPPTLTDSEGIRMFDGFRTNFGWAGPEFIKYIMKVGDDYVRAKIDKWTMRFATTTEDDSSDRFYSCLVGVAFAGTELAAEADIVHFDLERIYHAVIMQIVKRRQKTANNADYEAVLGDFQNANQNGTLIINEGRVIKLPSSGLVARINVEERMYYLSKTVMESYLNTRNLSQEEFITDLTHRKILIYNGKQRLSTGWPGMSGSTSTIAVLGFKYEIPPELFNVDNGP